MVGDHPQRAFQSHELTADWTFVRFHYGRRGRRGNYSPAEIETWARRIAQWRWRVEVYAYFNNDWEDFAVRNALDLRQRLGGVALHQARAGSESSASLSSATVWKSRPSVWSWR